MLCSQRGFGLCGAHHHSDLMPASFKEGSSSCTVCTSRFTIETGISQLVSFLYKNMYFITIKYLLYTYRKEKEYANPTKEVGNGRLLGEIEFF